MVDRNPPPDRKGKHRHKTNTQQLRPWSKQWKKTNKKKQKNIYKINKIKRCDIQGQVSPWHRTVCCECQQSVIPFDRWIRALLASTELKADGHMTSGLVLTQLKEGGRLGAYHHMLPYLFPLSIFPFVFHPQFSYCSSILPCDFNHKALKQRCATNVFYFKIPPFLHKLTRASKRHNHLYVKEIWIPSTHSDRNYCHRPPNTE